MTTQPPTVEHLSVLRTGAPDVVTPLGLRREFVAARAAGQRAGGRTRALVVAFPFASFGRTNAFITAVRRLPGVVAATPRRLHGGALYLSVDHAGNSPLDTGLAGLSEFRPRVSTDGDDMISVVIEAV